MHVSEDITGTLRANTKGHEPLIIAHQTVGFGRTADRIYINPEKSVTVSSQGGGMGAKSGLYLFKGVDTLNETARVRKLTPLECERLQGLPDNYTLIDDKSCSDSARYKAIGNGMAQPCADFVLRRIAEVS